MLKILDLTNCLLSKKYLDAAETLRQEIIRIPRLEQNKLNELLQNGIETPPSMKYAIDLLTETIAKEAPATILISRPISAPLFLVALGRAIERASEHFPLGYSTRVIVYSD
jgi:hypothetical protein